ncbi:MAG: cytochrome c biogenesis protein ResB [Candidatus Pristimantibacillus lignocellulolyticus]|uniref:Cytochrome c biogenesis protein ResB n=1 Tax=Candidatus Pristimantibacillus lignocellulolyticus TaxID=2994561 RepID=A0A9J6ZDA5_9BACL|nr:MAG: cytochrome c biogenesis protein ResB [Candidatus Pristimantibacillus lignocellulolyticus]
MLLPENTKCECGHQNAVGTVLCETCGKPIVQEIIDSNEPLEMRYDGVARRSQKANPDLLDKIWNFFSSVKIAIYLIIATFIGAMFGTIFPQANTFINNFDPKIYYEETYGTAGKIYYLLGLHNTYNSWWFITLLVMIGTSLVICSIDRVLPLYRALNKQQIRKHHSFLTRQKVTYSTLIEGNEEQWVQNYGQALKKKGYKVHIDGTALLAEKNRFSRWGPYINHIGLILVLLALLARGIPGWNVDNYVKVVDGDTVPISGTNYYVKSEGFKMELYDNAELPESLQNTGRVKNFETFAVLYECESNCNDDFEKPNLTEVLRHTILINDPLRYKDLKLHQFDYDLTPRINAVSPMITNKETGETFGPFHLSMVDPELNYEVGPYKITLIDKYMDFSINSEGEPITLSREPNAPAFIFNIQGPNLKESGEVFMYFPLQKDKVRFSQNTINRELTDKLEIKVDGMENVSFSEATTYLNIRIDKAVKFLWIGAIISMIGLLLGTYWQHRRIWLRIDEHKLTLGAHTTKNWYGMRTDTSYALGKVGIELDAKSLDNGGNKG